MNKKTNVMIIFTDQQRYDTIGALGYDYMKTPNLDRLCKEGTAYSCAHSHNPVCMPARHDLLLGMPASAHGYYANNEKQRIKDYSIPTLPRIFSDAGYRTAAIGKMHFSPARAHHGYNEMYLMEELPKHRYDDQYAMYLEEEGLGHIQNLHGVRPHLYHTPQLSQMDLANHETSWIKNQTIEWLKKNNQNPFFLFVGYIKPHPPWDIPKEYRGMYKDCDLKEPIASSRSFDKASQGHWYGDDDSLEQKRKVREAYFTTISMVDDSVGEIIEYLRERGDLDDTLIIFTSDHGEMLQDKGYYSKQLPYDSSVRVPMIIRYPKAFTPGLIKDDFVDLMDLLPTCLDVCDLEYPGNKESLYGESLCEEYPLLDREKIICACEFLGPRRWVMSRNRRYKYIYRYNGGKEEVYDMMLNPDETINIIDQVKGSPVYEELREAALEYEKVYGPDGAVDQDEWLVFEEEAFDGWHYGKYHLWSNSQTQAFYHNNQELRASTLYSEMLYAVSDLCISGTRLNQVFHDRVWMKDFSRKAINYGDFNEDMLRHIFEE